MKAKLLIAALTLFAIVGWSGQTKQSRTAWEYKLIFREDFSAVEAEKVLNQMGADGWELVHFRPRTDYAGGDYYFKRPR